MTYPPELEAVLMKAIAKDPDKRHGSALEFARALEGTLPQAERAHGGERVAEFIKGLLGAQHEQQKAALAEALRRADRASMAPPASPIEGLVGTGTSSISSLSAVGLSRPSQDGLSSPALQQPSVFRRSRVPLALALLALGVGGAAFAITRTSADKVEPHPAAPVPTATEPRAPEMKLDALPVEPTPSATETTSAPEPPPADSATAAPRVPKGTSHAPPASAAVPTPAPPPKKRGAWRQDPGF